MIRAAQRIHRRDAGAHGLSVNEHGACAALGQTATELRIFQTKIVAQCVEQRHVIVGVDRV
jgi:hypothetical protein